MLEEKKIKFLDENEQQFKIKRKESRLANDIGWINQQRELKKIGEIEQHIEDRK
jgi:hypothetical protein